MALSKEDMHVRVVFHIFTSHQSEWLSLKCLQIINSGEGVEKKEPSYTVGGNINGEATMENSGERFTVEPLW